jgi:4a-hydroxytetrahydrobiopterin dehydratase
MPSATAPLAAKSCTPCRGGVPPLSAAEVERHRGEVPAWDVRDDGRRIERTFRFKNFAEAFALVQRVAGIAEAEGHHPDVSFGWGYATVSLHTHKIKGLHENDFIMAAKIDRAAEGAMP